jgi:hypothetical protein
VVSSKELKFTRDRFFQPFSKAFATHLKHILPAYRADAILTRTSVFPNSNSKLGGGIDEHFS